MQSCFNNNYTSSVFSVAVFSPRPCPGLLWQVCMSCLGNSERRLQVGKLEFETAFNHIIKPQGLDSVPGNIPLTSFISSHWKSDYNKQSQQLDTELILNIYHVSMSTCQMINENAQRSNQNTISEVSDVWLLVFIWPWPLTLTFDLDVHSLVTRIRCFVLRIRLILMLCTLTVYPLQICMPGCQIILASHATLTWTWPSSGIQFGNLGMTLWCQLSQYRSYALHIKFAMYMVYFVLFCFVLCRKIKRKNYVGLY